MTSDNENIEIRSKEEIISTYDFVGNNYGVWVFQGDDLLRASELLKAYDIHYKSIEEQRKIFEEDRGKHSFFGGLQMLRGMALECYLKAVLAARGTKLAQDGKIINGVTKTHKLLKISERVTSNTGIKFSEGEQSVMVRLGHWIEMGRYPVQTKWDKSQSLPDNPNSKGEKGNGWATPLDDDLFYGLIGKLRGFCSKS